MKPTGCGYKATRPLTKISFDESAQCDYDLANVRWQGITFESGDEAGSSLQWMNSLAGVDQMC